MTATAVVANASIMCVVLSSPINPVIGFVNITPDNTATNALSDPSTNNQYPLRSMQLGFLDSHCTFFEHLHSIDMVANKNPTISNAIGK